MRIEKLISRFSPSLCSVTELQNGIIIFSFSLIPVLMMSGILQIMIDQNKLPNYKSINFATSQDYNTGTLIYYLTISFVHIILCLAINYYFAKKTKNDLPLDLVKKISRYRLVCIATIAALFFIMDSLKLNISILSHDRIFDVLKKSDFYSAQFKMFTCDYLNINLKLFYVFSTFPFLLIFLALIIIVISSFSIGKDLVRFQKFSYEEFSLDMINKEIENIISNMKNYIFGLSIILTTSSLATILFFQLPVNVFEDQAVKNHYQQVSYSMGFCWAVIFSLTMVAMSLFPIIVILKKLNNINNTERYQKDKDFKYWVSINQHKLSLLNNLKTVLSIFAPIFISIVSKLFLKNI